MKAIISLFISAYRGNMASAECCSYSLPYPQSNSRCCSDQTSAYGAPPEHSGFAAVNYEDFCWAISRASKRETLGYYITYLRYVRYHDAYAKTVERAWLKRSNSELSQVAASQQWLQQHEEAFCHALHQQLIELNGRD
ncbi:conserved hypothetical protein [Vibrio chagasii]|uniref:hypothetical protein n=1 Tax=Vibrio chagasii TaxID=170679 RepID=UPI003373F24C|nr:conserved hypothetical protein [Vibrio chagasii]CAH7412935.1 conserved hypothetical protein [Vibrio chagasii]CAH7429277.1 conserved hypothetical protein [Vibrio chagasii]